MKVGHSETEQTTKNGPTDLFTSELAGSSSTATTSSSAEQTSTSHQNIALLSSTQQNQINSLNKIADSTQKSGLNSLGFTHPSSNPTVTLTAHSQPTSTTSPAEAMTLGGADRTNMSLPTRRRNTPLDAATLSTLISMLTPESQRTLNDLSSPGFTLRAAAPQTLAAIAHHNEILETPTPTKVIYPKSVTQEQEHFADGFTQALRQVQIQNQFVPTPSLQSPSVFNLLLNALTPVLSQPGGFPSSSNLSSPIDAIKALTTRADGNAAPDPIVQLSPTAPNSSSTGTTLSPSSDNSLSISQQQLASSIQQGLASGLQTSVTSAAAAANSLSEFVKKLDAQQTQGPNPNYLDLLKNLICNLRTCRTEKDRKKKRSRTNLHVFSMKQLCLPARIEDPQGPLQFIYYKNSPFAVDDEMNDRWDYLLADLSDETGTHRSDENLRYGEQRHQQPQRPNGHRMPMDQRGWMPPANSGYMDIFNQHSLGGDLTAAGGFPFINSSVSASTTATNTMLPVSTHLPLNSTSRNGLPQVKIEPLYQSAAPPQPMAALDLNAHPTQQTSSSSASSGRFNGHSHSLDMDDQERKKLERKRARNRAAASKCRQRKLERIQELEAQVQQERQRNAQLQSTIEHAKQELQQLRQNIEEHRQQGCPMSGFN